MRHLWFRSSLVFVLSLIWIVLTERFSVGNWILGVILAIGALAAADLLLMEDGLASLNRIRLHRFALYGLYLIGQAYLSGIFMIRRIINGRICVGFVDIKTDLEDDFFISILANSITLTPGTATVERNREALKVLWIECTPGNCLVADRLIKKKLEYYLRFCMQDKNKDHPERGKKT